MDPEPDEVKDEKCYEPAYLPLGVRSFADADVAHDAHERDEHARETTATFQAIVNNILYAEELSADEKSALIAQAAADMAARVNQPEGRRSLWDRVKGMVHKESPEQVGFAPGGAFTVYRDKATGEPRWMGIWSNDRTDREGERFTEAAHREYEAHVDRTGNYPSLMLWHERAAVVGEADQLAYDDRGFMVATGTFNELGKAIYKGLESYPEPLGMSHGYHYRASDLKDGEYHHYRTFEVSVLPLRAAANLKTAFGVEESMALREDKKRMFSAIGGEEFANEIEARVGAMADGKDLDPSIIAGLKDLLEGSEPDPADVTIAVDATALEKALAPVADGMAAILARLDQQDAAIKELQKTDDEKLSAAWGKSNVAALKGLAASSREDTVEDGRKSLVRGATRDVGGQYAEGGLDSFYLNAFTGKAASAVPTE